jgi:hypothetical protein
LGWALEGQRGGGGQGPLIDSEVHISAQQFFSPNPSVRRCMSKCSVSSSITNMSLGEGSCNSCTECVFDQQYVMLLDISNTSNTETHQSKNTLQFYDFESTPVQLSLKTHISQWKHEDNLIYYTYTPSIVRFSVCCYVSYVSASQTQKILQ